MRRLLLCCATVVLWCAGIPTVAAATPSDMPEAVKTCKTGYATYGFSNVGGCVSFVARGGKLTSAVPSLALTFNSAPCYNFPTVECIWSVEGAGLAPGREVIVGDADVPYGASVPVSAAGTVSIQGIYMIGQCVTPGYEILNFIARGTAPDGSTVESAVVTANLTTVIPLCSF